MARRAGAAPAGAEAEAPAGPPPAAAAASPRRGMGLPPLLTGLPFLARLTGDQRSGDWSGAPLVTETTRSSGGDSSDEDAGENASLRALEDGAHLQVQAIIVRLKPHSKVHFPHPDELQLRLAVPTTTTAAAGNVLQVNGVPIPGSEVATVLRRDRQGCYVSTDQLAVVQTATFEVYQDGHTWTCGRFVKNEDNPSTWALEFFPLESHVPDSGGGRSQNESPTCDLELCVVGKCCGAPCCLSENVQCTPAPPRASPRGAQLGRLPSLPSVNEERVMEEADTAAPLKFLSADTLTDLKEKSLMTYFDPAIEYARGDGTDPSWFGAGVRVGMGLGLGVCLGIGLGAGLLVSSYQRAQAAVKRIAPTTAAEVMRLR